MTHPKIPCPLCGADFYVAFDGFSWQCHCSSCYDPSEGSSEASRIRGVSNSEGDAVLDWLRAAQEYVDELDECVHAPAWRAADEELHRAENRLFYQLMAQLACEAGRQEADRIRWGVQIGVNGEATARVWCDAPTAWAHAKWPLPEVAP